MDEPTAFPAMHIRYTLRGIFTEATARLDAVKRAQTRAPQARRPPRPQPGEPS